MKRLIKKASQVFIHATSLDRLESILNQGLVVGQENGQFTADSIMNNNGIYVSDVSIKEDRLSSLEDFGSVLLEFSIDTNNMIPDPEYFNLSGPHPLSIRDVTEILEFVVNSNVYQQNYLSNWNLDDYDNDLEELIDNEYSKISSELLEDIELLKLIPPGMFNSISDYVYLGNISPSNITKVYIEDSNHEIHELDPTNQDEILELINQNI